jgi:hypothetical protein
VAGVQKVVRVFELMTEAAAGRLAAGRAGLFEVAAPPAA